MPTATADRKPAKAAPSPTNIFDRLANLHKRDVEAALVGYRGLVAALDADPTHEADPEHVQELLDALKIGPGELRADVEYTKLVRDTEAAFMTAEQRAANEAERVAKTAEVKAIREKLPQLQARVRQLEVIAASDSGTKADLARKRAGNVRLFGTLDVVRERIESGKPTGPKAGVATATYGPAMMVGTREDVMR